MDYMDIKMRTYDEISDAVGKNGFDLTFVCRKSNHPNDDYLYLVIAEKDGHYVSWLANTSGETVGLYEGHYCLSFKQAMEITTDKIYDYKEKR